MSDFEDLLHELAMIDMELEDLPREDIARRAMLRDRQHELRARLHVLVPTYDVIRPTPLLEHELTRIELRLREIEETLPRAEADLDTTDIDRRIEAGNDVPELRNRMAHLRRLLDLRRSQTVTG